jgi:Domain of unknown function (DUF4386)
MSMNTGVTMERIPEASPRLKARMAGLFELLEALTSGFGRVLVPRMLVVSGDAAATAANVLAHELLFRLGLAAAVIAVACHIAWTLLFYQLFKPVNRTLSLLAAFFGLVTIAMQAFSSLFQLAPLIVLEGGGTLSAFNVEQLQALALMFFKLNAHAFDIYLVFFGFAEENEYQVLEGKLKQPVEPSNRLQPLAIAEISCKKRVEENRDGSRLALDL